MDTILQKIKSNLSSASIPGTPEPAPPVPTKEEEDNKKRKIKELELQSSLQKLNTDEMVDSEEIAKASESRFTASLPPPPKSTIDSMKEKTDEVVRQAKSSFSVLQKPKQEEPEEDEDSFSAKQHQFWN